MSYEILVGANVTDEEQYQKYRQAMLPILKSYSGGFGYDFKVAEVLKSLVEHPINRVFTIRFPTEEQKDQFFSDANYLTVKKTYFEEAVTNITILASYSVAAAPFI